jgi:hypothetical protein
VLAELYEIHCFHLSGLFEFVYLFLAEPLMLVVGEEVLSLFGLALLAIYLRQLLADLLLVEAHLVFPAPPIVAPLLAHVMDVVVKVKGRRICGGRKLLLLGIL